MDSNALYDKLLELVFTNATDDKINMMIEEYANSEEDKIIARKWAEELRVSYALARQARAKVVDRMLMGIVLTFLALGITIYTSIVISRIFLWGCLMVVVGVWTAIANLIQLQKPLVEFEPMGLIFRRKLKG